MNIAGVMRCELPTHHRVLDTDQHAICGHMHSNAGARRRAAVGDYAAITHPVLSASATSRALCMLKVIHALYIQKPCSEHACLRSRR